LIVRRLTAVAVYSIERGTCSTSSYDNHYDVSHATDIPVPTETLFAVSGRGGPNVHEVREQR